MAISDLACQVLDCQHLVLSDNLGVQPVVEVIALAIKALDRCPESRLTLFEQTLPQRAVHLELKKSFSPSPLLLQKVTYQG